MTTIVTGFEWIPPTGRNCEDYFRFSSADLDEMAADGDKCAEREISRREANKANKRNAVKRAAAQ